MNLRARVPGSVLLRRTKSSRGIALPLLRYLSMTTAKASWKASSNSLPSSHMRFRTTSLYHGVSRSNGILSSIAHPIALRRAQKYERIGCPRVGDDTPTNNDGQFGERRLAAQSIGRGCLGEREHV